MMSPITVLIADPDRTRRRVYMRLLQPEKGIRVVKMVSSAMELIKASVKDKPRILMLNLNLLKGRDIALIVPLLIQTLIGVTSSYVIIFLTETPRGV